MTAPWNIKVIGRHQSRYGDQRDILPPDYYTVAVRSDGQWHDAGTAKTWWSAFWQGVAA